MPSWFGLRAAHGQEDRARGRGGRDVAPLERGGFAAAQRALEKHSGEGLVEGAAPGSGGGGFEAPPGAAGTVSGGEDGGEAVGSEGRGLPPAPVGPVPAEPREHPIRLGPPDRGAGERGPEGDGGDSDRGRGRRAPLLKQPPEVGGERGVGRGLVSPPGVELAQRAGIGGAGVRA